MFLLQNLGPAFGYIIGSITSKLYVDFYKINTGRGREITLPLIWNVKQCSLYFVENLTVTPQDSTWIGAWWLGYIILSLWVFTSAIPILIFPKRMIKNQGSIDFVDKAEARKTDEGDDQNSPKNSFKGRMYPCSK